MENQTNPVVRRTTRLGPVVLILLLVVVVLAACGGVQLPGIFAQSLPTPTPAPAVMPPQDAGAVVPVSNPPALSAAGDFGLQDRLIQLYREANPAVVYIIAANLGSGSGFVYDNAGHIVTNDHVVEGARNLEVVFANGERRPAELVGADQDADLAVIKVDGLPAGVTPLPLAAPEDLAVGQFVVAIGNPFGEQGSMSLGIVSGLGRSLSSQRAQGNGGTYTLPAVIQTDAPINPGNSGGPLLNLDGQVVGINAAIASSTGSNSGVGFSIPVAAVHRIVPSLISEGRYVYPYLGASFDEEISLAEQQLFDLPQTSGVYVITVADGGPAEQAGLRGADPSTGRGGDLITAINGQPLRNFQDLNRVLVFGVSPGQTIDVTFVRGGQEQTAQVTLGERP